jgi:hypothetical protein
MFYLIGGGARAGKSLLRQIVTGKYGISGIATDMIVQMMSIVLPEFGLYHDLESSQRFEKTHKLIQALLTYHPKEHFLIEGVDILPKHYLAYQAATQNQVRMCILGSSQLSPEQKKANILEFKSYNDWTSKLDEAQLLKLSQHLVKVSKKQEKQCQELGIAYFDTSADFNGGLTKAEEYLLCN